MLTAWTLEIESAEVGDDGMQDRVVQSKSQVVSNFDKLEDR